MAAPTVEQVQADISAATMLISSLLESTTDTVTIGAGKQLLTLGGSMKSWLEANKDALRGEPGDAGPMGDPGDEGDPGDKGPLGDKGNSWTVTPTATIAIDPSLDIPTIAMAYSSPNANYEFDLALAITVKLPNWKVKQTSIPILPDQPNMDVTLYAAKRSSIYPENTDRVWAPAEAQLRSIKCGQAMPKFNTVVSKYLDTEKKRLAVLAYRFAFDIWMRGNEWDTYGWSSTVATGDDIWTQSEVDGVTIFPACGNIVYSPNKGGVAALWKAGDRDGWTRGASLSGREPVFASEFFINSNESLAYVVFDDCTFTKDAGVNITLTTPMEGTVKPARVGKVHTVIQVSDADSPRYIGLAAPAFDGGKIILIDPDNNKLGEFGDALQAGDVIKDFHVQSKNRVFAYTESMDVYEIDIAAKTVKKIFTNDTGLEFTTMAVDGNINKVLFMGNGFYALGDVTGLGTDTKFVDIKAHTYPPESSPTDPNALHSITTEGMLAPNQSYDYRAPIYDYTKPLHFLGTTYDGDRRLNFSVSNK